MPKNQLKLNSPLAFSTVTSKKQPLSQAETRATLARRLRQAREVSGYGGVGGAAELCKELGYKATNLISKWERSGVVPQNVLVELAKAYGTTTDYLYGLTDDVEGNATIHLRQSVAARMSGAMKMVLESLVMGDYQLMKGVPPVLSLVKEAADSSQKMQEAMARFAQLNPEFYDDMLGSNPFVIAVNATSTACLKLKAAMDNHQKAIDYRYAHALDRTCKSTGQFDLFLAIQHGEGA
jgi:hypothetical protein